MKLDPTRWSIGSKIEVPDLDRPWLNYLVRYRLIQTPWFGIYLHRINLPDSRPTLHDHPWNFVSIVLKGGYCERRATEPVNLSSARWRTYEAGQINRMPIGHAHYIASVFRKPTWTLVFVGRRQRVWGYWDEKAGLRHWTRFDRHPYADEFDAALRSRR